MPGARGGAKLLKAQVYWGLWKGSFLLHGVRPGELWRLGMEGNFREKKSNESLPLLA